MKSSSVIRLEHVVALILLLSVSALLTYLLFRADTPEEVPKNQETIKEFIQDYLAYEVYYEEPVLDLFSKYMSSNVVDYKTLETFQNVFHSYDFGYTSCDFEVVYAGFVIIRLYNAEGEPLPPPIGFWYNQNQDGVITAWRLQRLLPFSKQSSEYSQYWEDVYG